MRLQSLHRLNRLTQVVLKSRVSKSNGCLTNFTREYWNKDWAAGPYPQTEEERVAAAKKYGLRREDYEPYPDDGDGMGDYPKLPLKGVDGRDPYEDWDYPGQKMNYGDPLHLHADVLGEDRMYPDKKYYIPLRKQFIILTCVVTTFVLFSVLAEPFKTVQPALPKQYPFAHLQTGKEPEKHYTFEAAA